jgi:hypothetical protein
MIIIANQDQESNHQKILKIMISGIVILTKRINTYVAC